MFIHGTNNFFHPNTTCHLCKLKGHFQQQCPVASDATGARLSRVESERNPTTRQEVSFAICGILLNHQGDILINPNWVLLDSESTHNIFKNRNMLTDVKATTDGEILRLHTSGGILDTNQKGQFGGLSVWFNPRCLANILSLALVSELFRVTLDTEIENAFTVHISEAHVMKFVCILPGLYVFDATSVDLSKLRSAFSFLNTVASNKGSYNKRDLRKADAAVTLNRRTNHVAEDKFVRIVKDNWVRNCPVTVGDVRRSHAIYGPPLPPIKGRTRYQSSPRVQEKDIIQIPKALYDDLKHVVLCADFYYVNGVTVFHSISRRLDYRAVSFPKSRSKASIVNELKEIFKIYNARGFRIVEIHADNEFAKVERDVLPARMVCCGVDDHVPEIERSIQTMKNENRAVCHAMPYLCLPRVMIRKLITQASAFLNAFGSAERAANGLSGRNIIDNLPHIDYNDLKHEFGEYVQLHVTEKVTNNMKSRTIGAVVLDPRNITGRYNFMSLETGFEINGRVTQTLPITDAVIQRVEELGIAQNQPYRQSKMLQYEWRPGMPIDDDDAIAILDAGAHAPAIIPAPIVDNLPDAGPNPFVPAVDVVAPPGAEEYEAEQPNIQEGVQNQGAEAQGAEARGAEDQGVEDQRADMAEADNNNVENDGIENDDEENVVHENDSDENEEFLEEDDKTIESDEETERTRQVERERRAEHFATNEGEEYGRGKRSKKVNQSYSSLQTSGDGGRKTMRRKKKAKKKNSFQDRKVKNVNKANKKKGKSDKKIKRSYSFLQTKFVDLKEEEKREYLECAWGEYQLTGKTHMMERYTAGLVFAQMSAKQGIKKYDKEAELKLIAEFAQLIEYKAFHGVKANGPDGLSDEQKRGAGDMINLIEEKINRGHTETNPVLKARSVFNGKVQRGIYTKEETASPTVDQDSLFITCIIDAIEGRCKATTDVTGAYLNARMKDQVIMRISGPEVGIFCKLDPTLAEFVIDNKGKKVLYVVLDKALYGCVQSSLLWYELYSTTLIDMGFKLNPYDLCVGNCNIDGSQCTICWYVDDNKISHMKRKVVEDVISKIEDKFGVMSKTYGDEHEFLGMNIKYRKGKVIISMKKHILKAINSFQDDITRDATSPAKGYLFEVRGDAKELGDERADNFHSVTASLLFVSRRCRLDIQTTIGYLCTRVGCPDEDDWAKLRRVLQYLRGTIDLTRILGADDMKRMESWVDVSYGVHDDCKSHTGGCISFGWGVFSTMCKKQSLNVKSSTEGEVVGVSDFLPNMIWTRMFLEEQGFFLEKNTLYQDNQSAMKIELNGRKSSGKKSKHIDNRFFFIKDRLMSEGIDVAYCPTAKMLADFFTKPLQGNLFRKFRDVVMGHKHVNTLLDDEEESSSKERVGNDNPGKDYDSSNGADDKPSDVAGKVSWAEVARRGNV